MASLLLVVETWGGWGEGAVKPKSLFVTELQSQCGEFDNYFLRFSSRGGKKKTIVCMCFGEPRKIGYLLPVKVRFFCVGGQRSTIRNQTLVPTSLDLLPSVEVAVAHLRGEEERFFFLLLKGCKRRSAMNSAWCCWEWKGCSTVYEGRENGEKKEEEEEQVWENVGKEK